MAPLFLLRGNDMSDKKIKCIILRDSWDEDGNRHRKGTEVMLDAEAAMDGIESGILSRVKAPKK